MAARDYTRLLLDSLSRCRDGVGLLVLDEVLPACELGMVPAGVLEDFLRNKPRELEAALTGRKPSPSLLELADYVTKMKKLKHPYDRGIQARAGIEF